MTGRTSNLAQVVAYIDPALKDRIEEARRKSAHRISMSAYIESVLRHHVEHQQKKRPGKVVNA